MKTGNDPRHQNRREAIKSLYSYLFNKGQELNEIARQTVKNLLLIDKTISDSAPEWPLEKINRIDLSILRLAVFELTIQKTEPEKVIIDEAVELAKEFGSEGSPSFINGVLGHIIKIL